MEEVSLRDFQLKPSSYLDRLPIVLTRYGRPIAKVIPIVIVSAVGESLETPPPAENPPQGEIKHGFCGGHFERGREYDLKEVAYENIDGVDGEFRWLCPKCLDRLETEIKRRGGKVIFKGGETN